MIQYEESQQLDSHLQNVIKVMEILEKNFKFILFFLKVMS